MLFVFKNVDCWLLKVNDFGGSDDVSMELDDLAVWLASRDPQSTDRGYPNPSHVRELSRGRDDF